mgnify:FL=1
MDYSQSKNFLESVRAKRNRVRRMEEALEESRARAEHVTGLQIGERVQSSNKASIDAMLAAIEEEAGRLEEAQKDLACDINRARELVNLVRNEAAVWHVLWERYIIGASWNAVAKHTSYGRRTVFRLAEQGYQDLDEKLALRGTPWHSNL